MIKVVLGLARVYEEEAETETETFDTEDALDIFLHEGRFWRQGGPLGWQSRKQNGRMRQWANTMLAPNPVIAYFEENLPDDV